MRLTWLGHSAFHIETAGASVLLDPFWTGNPKFPQGYEDKIAAVDAIALTHAHEDHLGDTVRLAGKHGAVVVAQFELANWLQGQGVASVEPIGIGGTVAVAGVRFTMVQAFHSSSITVDEQPVAMGDPAGLVIRDGTTSLYAAGDTGPFGDMTLIGRLYGPTVGLLPVGDRFTMGPEGAAFVCNELMELETIVPVHWGTFPLLPGEPEEFARRVTRGRVHIATPGTPFEV